MTQADAIIEMLSKHIPNYPPTIPAPSPVLNDGKADQEWLDARKLPFDTGPIPEDGKAEPDLSQRPPFVTGLSVLDSLKK